MNNLILLFKRIVKEGFLDLKNFGLRVSLAKIRWIISGESLNSTIHRNKVIYNYLFHNFSFVIDKYKDYSSNTNNRSNIIWCFWWTGEHSMPEVIKLCTKSKEIHSKNSKIIVLSRYNIKEYVEFPDFVWSQFESGNIRIQHLADMIRVQLIKNYGGIWLDASIYCVKDIPNHLFDMELFSLRSKKDSQYISQARWTTFAIGGHKDNVLCSFLNEFFIEYCKTGKPFIDYYMFDCCIALAYENISKVKKAIDNLDKISGSYFWLDQHLRDDISLETFKSEDVFLFQKLGWRGYVDDPPNSNSLYYRLVKKEFINEES